MRTDFTPITNAVQSLIEVITNTHAEMLAEANEQRRELLALHDRMRDTLSDMSQFSRVMRDTANQIEGVAVVSEDLADLVTSTILGSFEDVPTCNYEEFVGYCDMCGETISTNDVHTVGEYDELVCAECASLANAEDVTGPTLDNDETAAE